MIEDPINPRFEGTTLVIETNDETQVYDSQFLVAALLVYVAKGDGSISPPETEEMLKVAAADGRKDAEEMEKLHIAAEIINIPPDVMHQAFDDYFSETMA